MEGRAIMKWGYCISGHFPCLIDLSIENYCHALVTGGSGSGKSYALLYLLGTLLQEHPDIELYFCDFKNSKDFAFLSGYAHYYNGDACYQGLMDYYKIFCEIRKTGRKHKRHLLIFDEYPAFINYVSAKDKQDKTKNVNDVLNAIAEILMLGRGISYGVYIVTQRADAALFANGARDNFMIVIGLGRMSKEQKSMVFSGEDVPNKIYHRGEGILLANGYPLQEIAFPKIRNIIDWKHHIKEILLKQNN